MTFPVVWTIVGLRVHAHAVMEVLGYAAGARLYVVMGRRMKVPTMGTEAGLILVVGCLAGAMTGSKLLAMLESIQALWPARFNPRLLFGGKTIVGGLAGGWAGVEIAKWALRDFRSTGDRFVFPILVGLSLGRVGCFLEGLPDHTYGIATRLPWGVDFGDGIRRHPTQLYEIVFCLVLAGVIWVRMRRPWRAGELFRWMVLGYFGWRFCVEFIKPRETYGGLSPIQMTSAVMVCLAAVSLCILRKVPAPEAAHA